MRLLKSFILLFFIAAAIWADGGSLYTRQGIGDLYFSLSARRFALGGGGIALSSIDDYSNLNPAGWASIPTTRFEASYFYNGMNLQSSSEKKYYDRANLAGFALAIPLDRDLGIVASAGFVPYSHVSYEVVENQTSTSVGDYTSSYSGNGGINKVFFGISSKLPLGFAFGITYEYYYGDINYNTTINFASSSYNPSVFKNQNKFLGGGVNIGLLSPDLSSLFGSKDITGFKFGMTFNYIFRMTRDSTEISGNSDSTYISSSKVQTVKMPYSLSLGAALKLFNRYQFVADFMFQKFDDFSIENLKLGIYKNLYRYSFGVEYANPNINNDSSYWDKIALRLGFSYEETQYFMNSQPINQYALHVGFSLPIISADNPKSITNNIDVGFQIGKRGTTENNLLQENFYNLTVGISIGELWFIRSNK